MEMLESAAMRIEDISTPALIINLPSMERNIATMSALAKHQGISLRPYVKTHKSTVLAHKQLEAGAVGIGCATIDEAEVMAASGIRDILIGNQVVGSMNIARLTELARQVDIMVAVDDYRNVGHISTAASHNNVKVRILVEVDLGTRRCGVEPGEAAVLLAKHVTKAEGLAFCGFMGFEAHLQLIAKPEMRVPLVEKYVGPLVTTARMAEAAGLKVGIVSAGGTVTSKETAALPGVTEIQPGTYIFMDSSYYPRRPEFECALSVLATVISRPSDDYFIIDAGSKALSQDSGMPEVKNLAGARLVKLWEEHGKVEVTGPGAIPQPGDRIEVIPSHACTTVNLHGRFFAIRDGAVEAIWGISTRASQPPH
jgi:D-serine deaminase-like pyridoxal phosphate-dependent protein